VRRNQKNNRRTINDIVVDAVWHYLEKVSGKTKEQMEGMAPPVPPRTRAKNHADKNEAIDAKTNDHISLKLHHHRPLLRKSLNVYALKISSVCTDDTVIPVFLKDSPDDENHSLLLR
jgi:hypothetical protein